MFQLALVTTQTTHVSTSTRDNTHHMFQVALVTTQTAHVSTSTSEKAIALTRIPNLFLLQGNNLVQSFSSQVVLPIVVGNKNI